MSTSDSVCTTFKDSVSHMENVGGVVCAVNLRGERTPLVEHKPVLDVVYAERLPTYYDCVHTPVNKGFYFEPNEYKSEEFQAFNAKVYDYFRGLEDALTCLDLNSRFHTADKPSMLRAFKSVGEKLAVRMGLAMEGMEDLGCLSCSLEYPTNDIPVLKVSAHLKAPADFLNVFSAYLTASVHTNVGHALKSEIRKTVAAYVSDSKYSAQDVLVQKIIDAHVREQVNSISSILAHGNPVYVQKLDVPVCASLSVLSNPSRGSELSSLWGNACVPDTCPVGKYCSDALCFTYMATCKGVVCYGTSESQCRARLLSELLRLVDIRGGEVPLVATRADIERSVAQDIEVKLRTNLSQFLTDTIVGRPDLMGLPDVSPLLADVLCEEYEVREANESSCK